MTILTTTGWQDYELIDSGSGQKLERYGQYILVRPDPQAIWKPALPQDAWQRAHAVFRKTAPEKGVWETRGNMPAQWVMSCSGLKFYCKLTPFKHTGVFPEQSVQWDWIEQKVRAENRALNILNLFAYTGIATLIAARVGAKVTHVDASYQAITWAKENQKLANLSDNPIRWIVDDAIKFCKREQRRGVKYDGIVMDPPVFGHGPKGERWDFNKSFPQLLEICANLLSEKFVFFLVNAYAVSASALMLKNCLQDTLKNLPGTIEEGELAIKETSSKRLLSTGIFATYSKNLKQ